MHGSNVSHIHWRCYRENNMNRTNWRIAEQSKQKMVKALLLVMEQYNYKEITVTQITQEAQLSRKTFYRLFSDKDDILKLFCENLFHQCFAQIRAQKIQHYWDVVQVYFDFWEERKDLLFLLQKNNLLTCIFEHSYRYSIEVFGFVRSKEVATSFALPLPYMLAYSVGGMHSMLLKWIEKGMDVPSSELISKLKSGFMSNNI